MSGTRGGGTYREGFAVKLADDSSIKTISGLAIASVKTVNGTARASIKTVNDLQ